MNIRIFFAWFFLITTSISMVALITLFAIVLVAGVWDNLFYLSLLNLIMGAPLIMVLWDYIKLKKKEKR